MYSKCSCIVRATTWLYIQHDNNSLTHHSHSLPLHSTPSVHPSLCVISLSTCSFIYLAPLMVPEHLIGVVLFTRGPIFLHFLQCRSAQFSLIKDLICAICACRLWVRPKPVDGGVISYALIIVS